MQEAAEPVFSVSEFVAVLNQTLDYAYPAVVLTGELANLRVSKGKWLYFDLKDELATVKFFGTVYQLPGPLEDGMILKVRGTPRLHPQYGFSVTVQSIQPAGEGTIRRAAQLLQAKLTREGLFEETRKRTLAYPPQLIGLIASKQSAAYTDFVKVLGARWQGIKIELIDVQVQGDIAPEQIVAAIDQFNTRAAPPDVLVVIRGGGSPEDLSAFSTEQVTRAVAASRVPTLVAIGHEVDLSLAELAADLRASTPSNAAELLVPDRTEAKHRLKTTSAQLERIGTSLVQTARDQLNALQDALHHQVANVLLTAQRQLASEARLLAALSPDAILNRGYAIVRQHRVVLRSTRNLATDAIVEIQLKDGRFNAQPNKGTKI